MNKHSRALFLIAVSFVLTAYAQQSAPPQRAASPTVQGTVPQKNPRIQTVQFESKLVGKTLPYNVLLPVDYNEEASKTKRYPVVYLLHGLTGHYTNWLEKTKLTDHAAPYGLIVVTPEGNDSWYSDSVTAPTEKYETYIINELLPDVQRRYRTLESREGRAIAGLSMGGYGALKFGIKYPQAFVFAGSMSGALDAASWKEADLRGLQFIWRTLQPVFGPDEHPSRSANDLQKIVRELSVDKVDELPYIYLDCGTEDVLLQSNRNFAEILLQRKIKHEYRQLPGAHNWLYWNAQVQEVLKLAAIRLNACNC